MSEVRGLVALKLHDQSDLVGAARNAICQAGDRIVIRVAHRENTLLEADQACKHISCYKLSFKVVVVRAEPHSKHHRIDVNVSAQIQLVEIALLHKQ